MDDHTTISTFQLFKMFPDNESARVYLEARLREALEDVISASTGGVNGRNITEETRRAECAVIARAALKVQP